MAKSQVHQGNFQSTLSLTFSFIILGMSCILVITSLFMQCTTKCQLISLSLVLLQGMRTTDEAGTYL